LCLHEKELNVFFTVTFCAGLIGFFLGQVTLLIH
jgi:hypothetical protein